MMNQEKRVLTVTEITRLIKQILETGFSSIALQGEVSNFKRHTSGHLYFALKDQGAQISAVMWRSRAALLPFTPQDGMKVVVSGRITVYEVRGNYQIEVLAIRPLGTGDLQIAFEALKARLAEEGLFDAEHKKLLPEYPEHIGVVTSPTGAAIKDIVHVLRRRYPGVEVILNPVTVQGPGAPQEIARAIDEFNRYGKVDVLIVGRGGGSLEDLWAFNEEVVARAIYRSEIPVISAVGHEIDFTIADFVADLRAPTPSAAAELVVKDRRALLDILRNNWYTTHESIQTMVSNHKTNIRHILNSYSFNKPIDYLRQLSQQVDELDRGMSTVLSHKLAILRTNTDSLRHRIVALDPVRVLQRGYTIVYKEGRIVRSSKSLVSQDKVTIKFHDGSVASDVS